MSLLQYRHFSFSYYSSSTSSFHHTEPIPDGELDDKVHTRTDQHEAVETDEDPKAGNSLWFEEED